MRAGGYYHNTNHRYAYRYLKSTNADWAAEKRLKTCVKSISRKTAGSFSELAIVQSLFEVGSDGSHDKVRPFLASLERSN